MKQPARSDFGTVVTDAGVSVTFIRQRSLHMSAVPA
jgi:hypothetical protein